MAFDTRMLDLYNQTVQVQAPTGHDGYGERSHGTVASWPAIVVKKQERIATASGEERMSHTRVKIPGPPTGPASLDAKSKITLPDSTAPPILRIESPVDEVGDVAEYRVWF